VPATIGIVGAGSIGVAWAIVFARGGSAVALEDPDPQRLEAAPRELRARLEELAGFGLLGEPPSVVAARVRTSPDAVSGADYVQECAPEDLELKRELFADLDRRAPPDAILASSSSAITASATAGHLAGRARCLVAHPGNPPYLLPVVELVPAPFTRPDVVDRAAAILEEAGMNVVRVAREVEGFVFNRLQGALLREAYCLVRDGVVGVEDVDRVVREGLGPRWAVIGPFETSDLNTRGGIEVHAARMGPAYERMGAERGQHDPWTPELIATVTAERRALLPLEEWNERVAWRDRMLMAHLAGSAGMDADRLELTRLLYRYCAMLDSMELDLVPELFTPDCSVSYGPDERMQSHGADDLASSLRRLGRFARTSHHLSNVELDFDGPDAARGRSYVLAWHQHPDGRMQTLYAEYHDRFVRTDAGWRIAERRQLTHGSDVPWDLPLAQSERRRVS
jgi:3-hydroxyacyl-CoA dehydrogenase/3-phenylpropionate/cinnamic acid dioxygenase small subunit